MTHGWESPHPIEFIDETLVEVTHEYLQLTSDPFIEQMEDEDPSVLQSLLSLSQKLKADSVMRYQRKVLGDCVESLIENFYGEIAARS
jgi:hypothetical protein